MNTRVLFGAFAAFATQVNKLIETEESAVTVHDISLVGSNSISALASVDHTKGSQVSGALASVRMVKGDVAEVEKKLADLSAENPHVRPLHLMVIPPAPEKKAAAGEGEKKASKAKVSVVILVGTFQP